MEKSNEEQILARTVLAKSSIRPIVWVWLLLAIFFVEFVCILNARIAIFGEENTSDALSAIDLPVIHKTPSVKLFLFGDMMLDRAVRERMGEFGEEYPFTQIKDLLSGHDIVVGNLEGSFTDFKSKTLGIQDAPLEFTFDPAVIPRIKNLGFTLFSLANNHSANFGTEGLSQSRRYLSKNGIGYFGDPFNREELSKIVTIHGLKIAFVGFHEFVYQNLDRVLAEIAKMKAEADLVIVFPHWGIEYNKKATENQRELAHAFVDAGADVVVGAHPHVIEPIEIYKDKPIFYSLGNFVFDQDFSYDTTHGLTLELVYTKKKSVYKLIPVSIIKSEVTIASPDDTTAMLSSMAKLSAVSEDLKFQIKFGKVVVTSQSQ
jgi:poly-gamma-glutamate synthesis protein (capsule biosynthesis protein)